MSALFRLLFYGGLTKEEYDAIRGDIVTTNLRNLMLYAPVACIAFSVLLVASTLTHQGPPSTNQTIYLTSCLVMGAIMPCAHLLGRNKETDNPHLVSMLTTIFMVTLYAFSIALSVAHSEYPAVSAIVFLLVNPLLFVDRPIRAVAMTVAATIAICISSVCAKSVGLATDDVWNAITFGAIALTIDTLTMKSKLTQLFQAQEIAFLSKTDTLTKLRNRNNYESRLEDYPHSGAQTLVCAYADANGLRELNNTKGHDAGDELLCAIARQMRKSFGEKDTYRIGGDEFVAFVPDGTTNEALHKLERMQQKLASKGFSVSYGVSVAEAATANMRSLVRAAEKEMYKQKYAFHARNDA